MEIRNWIDHFNLRLVFQLLCNGNSSILILNLFRHKARIITIWILRWISREIELLFIIIWNWAQRSNLLWLLLLFLFFILHCFLLLLRQIQLRRQGILRITDSIDTLDHRIFFLFLFWNYRILDSHWRTSDLSENIYERLILWNKSNLLNPVF